MIYLSSRFPLKFIRIAIANTDKAHNRIANIGQKGGSSSGETLGAESTCSILGALGCGL